MEKQEIYGQNFVTSSGLLTATGAETVYDTTVAINYVINGKIAAKATVADGVTPVVDHNDGLPITLTANKGRVVVWGLIAGGTVKVAAGPIVDLDAAGLFPVAPQFPTLKDEMVPFAYQVLKAGATLVGTATFGTTNWNATGFTQAIVNVAVLPNRPQIT